MNLIDVIAVAAIIGGMLIGWRTGAIPQVFGLIGAAIGIALVLVLAPSALGWFGELEPPIRAFVAVGGAFIVVGFGEAIGSGIGTTIRRRLGNGVISRVDGVLGGIVGAVQAVVLIWLIGGLVAASPFESAAAQAQRSVVLRALASQLPPPTAFADDLFHLLDASGVPQLFEGFEPFPAEPVDVPGSSAARTIAGPALASTVKVQTNACRQIVTGTGFAVRADYVVTNAHVVAGGTKVVVVADGRGESRQLAAAVVLFDPSLDIAVLRVPGLRADPIALAKKAPARGTKAAAIGHPNGGKLTTIAAGVTAVYPARGFDLYGVERVERRVVELRADIVQGDSGGPLVLPDGTVGGVVFAEARNDPAVGYALAPDDVAVVVAPALSRTKAVDVGPCTH